MKTWLTFGCAALVVACSSAEGEDDPPEDDGSGGSGAGAPVGGGGGGGEDRIRLDATLGTISVPFGVDITGSGTDFVGEVALSGATGTMDLGGAVLDAAIYERVPFGEWVLYQTLAVTSDRWYVAWHYCKGETLEWIYYEGTDGTLIAAEPATGTCTETGASAELAVSFPAVDMPLPPLVSGFTIDGPDVQLAGATPGSLALGTPHVLLPFGEVDCTVDCGTPGWRELHAILWDRPAERACFAILYLFEDDPQIQVHYALTLPDLSDPVGDLYLDASWTHAP